MADIIKLNTPPNNVLEFLEEVKRVVMENHIDNLMIACKDKEEQYVYTGYAGLNEAEKQELLGHIQVDIVRDMIDRNYIT